jgi:restriction system protein
LEALTALFSFLYPFWPLILLLGFRRLFKNDCPFSKRIQRGVGEIFLGWLVWASFRYFLHVRGRQLILLLPKAVDDSAFFIVGAVSGGISILWMLWRWRRRWIRLSRIKHLEDMKSLSPEDFEALVAKLFKSNGHKVSLVGGHSDHGVDIVVTNAQREKWIVQCKRYSGSVGEPVVRDLYGTLLHEEAQGAYLMTTGTFTQKAQDWVVGKAIILYDGEALVRLIQETQS